MKILKKIHMILLIIVTAYTVIAFYMSYGIKTYRLGITLGMILSYSLQISVWIMVLLWLILAVRVVLWMKRRKKAKSENVAKEMAVSKLESEEQNIVPKSDEIAVVENEVKELGEAVEC